MKVTFVLATNVKLTLWLLQIVTVLLFKSASGGLTSTVIVWEAPIQFPWLDVGVIEYTTNWFKVVLFTSTSLIRFEEAGIIDSPVTFGLSTVTNHW